MGSHINIDVKGVLMFRKTSVLFLFFGLLSFIEFAGHFQDWQNILRVNCKNKHMHHIGEMMAPYMSEECQLPTWIVTCMLLEIHIVWCGCPFLTQHLESTGVMIDSDVCDFQLAVNY